MNSGASANSLQEHGQSRENACLTRTPILRLSRTVLALALITAIVAASLALRPAYRWFKGRRAVNLASQVDALVKAGRLEAAARPLQMALHLGPKELPVLRAAARYCSRARQPEGLRYWELVLAHRDAAREDRIACVDLALQLRRTDLAGRELEKLLRDTPSDLAVQRMVIQLRGMTGDRAAYLSAAQAALRDHPEDELCQYVVGVALYGDRRAPTEARESARRLLWGLAVGEGPHREEAVDALIRGGILNPGQKVLLLKALDSRANPRVADCFRAVELRFQLQGEDRVRFGAAVVSGIGPDAPPVRRAGASSWMGRSGQWPGALALLPLELCRTNRLLAGARLDALFETQDWDSIKETLAAVERVIEPALLESVRGAVAARQPQRQQAPEGHFRKAIQLAAGQPSLLPSIARHAELSGLPFIAVDAYRILRSFPGAAVDASREILRILEPLDDLDATHETLRELKAMLPGDEAVARSCAWIELLLNIRLDEARACFQQATERNPDDLSGRFGLAFARLRGHDDAGALELLEGKIAGFGELQPQHQAVYVAILGANQHRDAARRYARQIDPKRLRSRERELVAHWL